MDNITESVTRLVFNLQSYWKPHEVRKHSLYKNFTSYINVILLLSATKSCITQTLANLKQPTVWLTENRRAECTSLSRIPYKVLSLWDSLGFFSHYSYFIRYDAPLVILLRLILIYIFFFIFFLRSQKLLATFLMISSCPTTNKQFKFCQVTKRE